MTETDSKWLLNIKKSIDKPVMICGGSVKGKHLNYKNEIGHIDSINQHTREITVVLESSGKRVALPDKTYYFCDINGKEIKPKDEAPQVPPRSKLPVDVSLEIQNFKPNIQGIKKEGLPEEIAETFDQFKAEERQLDKLERERLGLPALLPLNKKMRTKYEKAIKPILKKMGIKACKKCDPSDMTATKDGDVICRKCGVVLGPSAYKEALEKDEEDNIIHQEKVKIAFENLSDEEKFKHTLREDLETLATSTIYGALDITQLVDELFRKSEAEPIFKVKPFERIALIASRVYLEHKLTDGRKLSEVRENLVKHIKHLTNTRGDKVGDKFDHFVSEFSKDPKILAKLENLKKTKSQKEEFLNKKRLLARTRIIPLIEKQVIEAKLRNILESHSVDKLKSEVEKLGLTPTGLKSELINQIISLRMKNIRSELDKTKSIQFDSYEEKMEKILKTRGRPGLLMEAEKVEVDGVKIKNLNERSNEQLIILLSLYKTIENLTEKTQIIRQANDQFRFINDQEKGKNHIEQKKLDLENEKKAREFAERVNKKQQLIRKALLVRFDINGDMIIEKGERVPLLVRPEAHLHEKYPKDPRIIPKFVPTTLRGVATKLKLMEKVEKAKEELGEIKDPDDEEDEDEEDEEPEVDDLFEDLADPNESARLESLKELKRRKNLEAKEKPIKEKVKDVIAEMKPSTTKSEVKIPTIIVMKSHSRFKEIKGSSGMNKQALFDAFTKLGVKF